MALLVVCYGCMFASFAGHLRPPYPRSDTSLPPSLLSQLHDAVSSENLILSQQQRDEFAATGLLVLRAALPTDVVHALREIVEAEPPLASPLFQDNLDFVVSYAWYFYRSFGQLSGAGVGASLATQLFNGADEREPARLINSVVYGIGRSQHGADWHTDEISYRPLGYSQAAGAGNNNVASISGVSVWMPLQHVRSLEEGGGLWLVPRNTASTACFERAVHNPSNGRVRQPADRPKLSLRTVSHAAARVIQ